MDRRKNERYRIPGAQIVYKLKNGHISLVPLVDLTRSSAKFQTRHPIQLGTSVDMELLIPEDVNIILRGKVIRLSDPSNEKISTAIAKFMPFRRQEKYNSLYSYNLLNKLVKEYAEA
jgi:hypothetical protein